MYDEYGILDEYKKIKESKNWILYDIHQGQVPDTITQAIDIAYQNGYNIYSNLKQSGDVFKITGAWAFLLLYKG